MTDQQKEQIKVIIHGLDEIRSKINDLIAELRYYQTQKRIKDDYSREQATSDNNEIARLIRSTFNISDTIDNLKNSLNG